MVVILSLVLLCNKRCFSLLGAMAYASPTVPTAGRTLWGLILFGLYFLTVGYILWQYSRKTLMKQPEILT